MTTPPSQSVSLRNSSAQAAPSTPAPRVGLVLASLMLAAFVAILNETVLGVALPQMMIDFQVTADVAQWFTTGFLLTMAVVIPMTGYLSGRFSRRTLFVAAMGFFIVGTVLAALAGSFGAMLAARVVQAVGTAIILPLLMSTTIALVAPERRGLMMGVNAVVISVGPALGPTLAGVVMHSLSWHWVFWLMLPIAVLVLVLGGLSIRLPHERQNVSLDVASVLLAAVGFGGVVYALSSASAILEGDLLAVAIGLVGVVGLALFGRRQVARAATGEALLDLAPLANAQFRRSVTVLSMGFAVMLGTVVVLPIYFQNGVGLDVLQTGLLLLGGGLTQAIASPIFGRVFDKFGPRPLVIPGTIVMALSSLALSTIDGTTASWLVVTYFVIFSAGVAAVASATMTAAMSSLEPRMLGHGSAILNTLQQVGGAIGTAALVAALTIGGAGAATPQDEVLEGTQVAFLLGAVVAAIAAVIALRIRGGKPAGAPQDH